MKVALVYDRINKWGGAERILLALHKIFPDAPLFTSVYDNKSAPWAKTFDVRTSFLQNIPFAKNHHELLPFLMPIAFESFNFDAYDLVISVTSESAKGIITKPGTSHICICLTPVRYLWSGYREYFTSSVFRLISRPIVNYLRWWDKIAASRPDSLVAISQEVQKRIDKYYNKNSKIIYPPLEFAPKNIIYPQDKGYFLVVSRLVPYKRVDIAVEACTMLNLSLKVVGIGSEEKRLKEMAGKTIEFVGKVTDEELAGYYANAKALIFPGFEDFGLTMVEAQSMGTPVVAFKKGGAFEIVLQGRTGKFFDRQQADSLASVLQSFNQTRYNSQACKKNALRFSEDHFVSQIQEACNKL